MKTLAYVAIAVILGVSVMIVPFIAVPTPSTSSANNPYEEWGLSQGLSPQRALEGFYDKVDASESATGVVPNYPVDLISVCLMFLSSSAFALSVSFLLKRSVLFLRNRKLRSDD